MPRSRDKSKARKNTVSISVVVPVYNSQQVLHTLIKRLEQVLVTLSAQFELILVNDGSRDESWSAIKKLAAQYPFVVGINLLRNYGQHNALLCGIREARYGIIVTIDDDLQHPPEEIPKLMAELQNGFDVVYGRPMQEEHGIWRDFASQITKLALQSSMGVRSARNVSPFRIFRTKVRESFYSYQGPFPNIDVLLTWGATQFGALPVRHEPRRIGKSNYNFTKLLSHAMNMITGFSVLPLQLAGIIGILFTFFGLAIFVYVVTRYVLQDGNIPVQGFTFLASIISIFSGAQLFALGIIGEYIARMHFRIMDRPVYIVESKFISQNIREE
jgi:undecaprenyl-phosphate 4-deoxy-4-formamido-L-arabinose transferase